MNDLDLKLQQVLQEKKQQHRYRSRRVSDSPQQIEVIIDNKKIINFCSNDYLGFANHPKVKQAAIEGINQFGVGSGAAHLINGHTQAHHQLEEELAELTGYPRCLLFSTGYMANIGLCQALLDKHAYVFEDKLNHASLIDGGLISKAHFNRYLHNDMDSLQDKIEKSNKSNDYSETKLILSDSVFSMDGDIADLPSLISISKTTKSWLMLDDAHGFGVLGKKGKGCLEHFNINPDDAPVYMATLGKAIGTAGAFIAGSDALIETLIQQARTYIYTTAMPAAIASATSASLKLLNDEPEHLHHLNKNIAYFRKCCQENSLPVQHSETAIQPVIVGNDEEALSLSKQLFEQGLLVTAIRPPTVPQGTARLRITLSAAHNSQHIDQLVTALKTALPAT